MSQDVILVVEIIHQVIVPEHRPNHLIILRIIHIRVVDVLVQLVVKMPQPIRDLLLTHFVQDLAEVCHHVVVLSE